MSAKQREAPSDWYSERRQRKETEMTSFNPKTNVEVKSIRYQLQREGGSVHQVQVDPCDGVIQCSCQAYQFGRCCWAMRLLMEGSPDLPKPRVRVTVRRSRPLVVRDEAMQATISNLDV